MKSKIKAIISIVPKNKTHLVDEVCIDMGDNDGAYKIKGDTSLGNQKYVVELPVEDILHALKLYSYGEELETLCYK